MKDQQIIERLQAKLEAIDKMSYLVSEALKARKFAEAYVINERIGSEAEKR